MKNNLLFVAHSNDMDRLVHYPLETSALQCPWLLPGTLLLPAVKSILACHIIAMSPTRPRAEAMFLHDSSE